MAPESFRPALDNETLEAFRHLCELVQHPTQRSVDAAVRHDWSGFPRIATVVAPDPTPARLGVEMRTLLETAYTELAPAHPSTEETLSGLDVVRIHLLEGLSWDAITAERMERGHPVSARTLRTRQREGLEAILTWAAEGEGAEGAEDHASDSNDVVERRSTRLHPIMISVAAVLVAGVVWLSWPEPPSPAAQLSAHHVGHMARLLEGAHTLPAPLPPVELPLPGHVPTRAMVVPDGDGRFGLILIFRASGDEAGFTMFWNPHDEIERWRYRIEVEPHEVRTHATLPDDVHEMPFWPSDVYYGNWNSNLGDRIAVTHFQANSPCFTTLLHLDDKRELGRYVHPGRLESGVVVDIDDSGDPELILAGPDNAVNRPVLVVLDPDDVRGAASTVAWKGDSGDEDARARVLLPDVPRFRAAVGVERLHVGGVGPGDWDPVRGSLDLSIGVVLDGALVNAYQLSLDRTLRPGPGIVIGDQERRAWEQLGLTPPTAAEIRSRVEVVEGRGARPRRAEAGPSGR